MNAKEIEQLFWQLYNSKNETDVDKLIQSKSHIFHQSNWSPLGGLPNNIGVVKNQQANPVAALVEKLTNSIDAILMRRCYEESINPKSAKAPRTIENAIAAFFPEHKHWDLQTPRNRQAESVQIIADGYHGDTANTSIVIYDDGEGQHPEEFENTFLSLIRDNKREIPFVQGKYNMGGSGAITFCGKKRYQLIASKRYDRTGNFGFTLIREHPLSSEEAWKYDEPWYEYLKIDGRIASFEAQKLDLRLRNRDFCTGTIIKLYSYDVKSNRHLGRDMGRSINEFLFEPALPITIVESAERYPNPKAHTPRVIFGLKRRLEGSNYLETPPFSEEIIDRRMGKMKATVYVFNTRVEGKTAKETKETVRDEFFKNRMQVLFSLNGQVHAHYTLEFISRTLKFSLLKDYVLINVDCTDMKPDFRRELFMASRDRLKQGEESSYLRKKLGESLRSGRLRDIYKSRKDRLAYDSADGEELLKQIAEDLPMDKGMRDLIKQTLELDEPGDKPKTKNSKRKTQREPFKGKRYPSFFRINSKSRNGAPVVQILRGDSKTITFDSDVVEDYFDRTDNPGGLDLAVMTYTPNEESGGDQPGTVNDISDFFSVTKRSPREGKIRIVIEPTENIQVGDAIKIQADLHSSANPNDVPPAMFWVVIKEQKEQLKSKPPQEESLGLPKPVLVYAESKNGEDNPTWESLPEIGGMDHSVIMHPFIDDKDKLEKIYINMDSHVLKTFKSKKRNPSEEQRELADRQYISRVYYHTLFLYAISRNRKYAISQMNGHDDYDEVDLTDYVKDVFESRYAEFLLNFETSALMEGLG